MRGLLIIAITFFLAMQAIADEKSIIKNNNQATQTRQSKQQISSKSPQTKPKEAKFSMEDIEVGRIDPAYAGLNIVEVVRAIEAKTALKKGEFESTADYNSRRAAALSGNLMGKLALDDPFVFVVPVKRIGQSLDGINYKYDADSNKASLYVLPRLSSLNGIGAPDYNTNRRLSNGLDRFEIDIRIDAKSRYQASNAYGATVSVEKTDSTRFGIATKPISFLNIKREIVYTKPLPVIELAMENSRASVEMPALKALVILKLSDPYVLYDFLSTKPTRDDPTERTSQGKYLTGNVLTIVFYSGVTGEVFARIQDHNSSQTNISPPSSQNVSNCHHLEKATLDEKKTKWFSRMSKLNGCEGEPDFRVSGIEGYKESYCVICVNKTLNITCEFDGEVSESPYNGLPSVKVYGKDYGSKPACWR